MIENSCTEIKSAPRLLVRGQGNKSQTVWSIGPWRIDDDDDDDDDDNDYENDDDYDYDDAIMVVTRK